jgi:hypothetical protein
MQIKKRHPTCFENYRSTSKCDVQKLVPCRVCLTSWRPIVASHQTNQSFFLLKSHVFCVSLNLMCDPVNTRTRRLPTCAGHQSHSLLDEKGGNTHQTTGTIHHAIHSPIALCTHCTSHLDESTQYKRSMHAQMRVYQ